MDLYFGPKFIKRYETADFTMSSIKNKIKDWLAPQGIKDYTLTLLLSNKQTIVNSVFNNSSYDTFNLKDQPGIIGSRLVIQPEKNNELNEYDINTKLNELQHKRNAKGRESPQYFTIRRGLGNDVQNPAPTNLSNLFYIYGEAPDGFKRDYIVPLDFPITVWYYDSDSPTAIQTEHTMLYREYLKTKDRLKLPVIGLTKNRYEIGHFGIYDKTFSNFLQGEDMVSSPFHLSDINTDIVNRHFIIRKNGLEYFAMPDTGINTINDMITLY